MWLARMAATVQKTTVRELLMDLMWSHIQDLRARGVLGK